MKPDSDPNWTISVIMPAHNAEETIAATLDSLLAQEWPNWSAVVVDNGSTDRTRAIADDYAARDARIAVIEERHQRGAGAARNAGLAAIRKPWVLFLDADDTLMPTMMRRMMEVLGANDQADAVHCGWTFTDWQGNPISDARCVEPGPDLFPAFARFCAFAIHACIFRRDLLDAAGGFDPSLVTSEDFDLWQRIARLGARFDLLDAYLVTYRLRERLSWFDASRFLEDALRVVDRGHRADPRLEGRVVPALHADGMPIADLFPAQVHMAVWAAGLQIAHGIDATPLLASLPSPPSPLIDVNQIADSLVRGIPLALCAPATVWLERWPEIEQVLRGFLDALEAHVGAQNLARRIASVLEMRVLKELRPLLDAERRTIRLNATAALAVDVHAALEEVSLPGLERAVFFVFNHGHYFGEVVLPVVDGAVSRLVIKDAIAARFAWPLLNSHFSSTIYPALIFDEEPDGWTVRRITPLAQGLENNPSELVVHDLVGWTVFVQELLGLPDWSIDQLYDWSVEHPDPLRRSATGGIEPIELSEPLPTLYDAAGEVALEIRIGGATAFVTSLPAEAGEVSAARIRAVALDRGKMELARITVREAIVGYSDDIEIALRPRLKTLADAARPSVSTRILAGTIGDGRLADFAARVAPELADTGTAIVGTARTGDAAENLRRAELPSCIAADLPAGLRAFQPAVALGDAPVGRAFYLPDLIAKAPSSDAVGLAAGSLSGKAAASPYGRHHFERLFASGADPWKYTSRYEQTKYEQTLALVPPVSHKKVLEIGCAEGHFTAQLAPLAGSLLATDISELALARTAARCAQFGNISYAQLDLLNDELPGRFDLIVCSELLYYMGELPELAAVGARLANSLSNGGHLLTAHANLVVDDPDATGFDWRMSYGAKRIGETFAALPDLVFQTELSTPLYRIQLFQKRNFWNTFLRRDTQAPRKTTLADNAAPEPEVARHILWDGGSVISDTRQVTTDPLPILMYHAVSESGPDALSRWRVTPSLFDAQLRYLRSAGFEPTSFEEWRSARERFTPLTGRRILLTFDDVYADFEEHALPLLLRYGFDATLFVPAEKVGGVADWDAWSGTSLPLLGWDGLARAQAAGMRIGSHGASHCQLAGLAPADVAKELWRSRATIEASLGIEVEALAYPSGSSDEIVEHLAPACGYRHAVTTRPGPSRLDEQDFALSRIEVAGGGTLESFIRLLPE